MSKEINFIDLLSNALQIRRTSLFILFLGITIRLDLIDGSDEKNRYAQMKPRVYAL